MKLRSQSLRKTNGKPCSGILQMHDATLRTEHRASGRDRETFSRDTLGTIPFFTGHIALIPCDDDWLLSIESRSRFRFRLGTAINVTQNQTYQVGQYLEVFLYADNGARRPYRGIREERELQLKREVERTETEREAGRQREIELEKLGIQAAGVKVDPETSSIGWTDAPTKLPELPNFVDRKDNLDCWLTRSERFAEMSQWPLQKWASLLSSNLTERALGCYGRLPQAQALDYEKVKKVLVKGYDLT
ncbi:reverse transcriptase [Plakobranchus ocellatus]|uniref:Reverse transcriptase n=1 Tax=Plakobranchus ocellatus TaxID=259542 RepID=A0AAV4BS87_9GAST|nr:reverse transcriptase [Plakobranchus ocellatus]